MSELKPTAKHSTFKLETATNASPISTWITQGAVPRTPSVVLDNGVSTESALEFPITVLRSMSWVFVLFASTKTTDFTKDSAFTSNPVLTSSTSTQEDSASMSVLTAPLGIHQTDSASPAS